MGLEGLFSYGRAGVGPRMQGRLRRARDSCLLGADAGPRERSIMASSSRRSGVLNWRWSDAVRRGMARIFRCRRSVLLVPYRLFVRFVRSVRYRRSGRSGLARLLVRFFLLLRSCRYHLSGRFCPALPRVQQRPGAGLCCSRQEITRPTLIKQSIISSFSCPL